MRRVWLGVLVLAASVAACAGDGAPSEPDALGPIDSAPGDASVLSPSDVAGPGADLEAPTGDIGEPPQTSILRIDLEVAPAEWARLHADPNGEDEIRVALSVGGQTFPETEMELHGGYARTVPKKSYRITIADELGSTLDLFGDGLETQRRFVLKASWNDRTWMRGPLTMALVRAQGGLAPREVHAELYVNEVFEGLYVLSERIDRPYLARQGLEDDEVNLYKAESHAANWAPKADPLQGYDHELGEAQDVGDLAALLDACGKTPATQAAFAAQVEPWLRLDDFLIWQRVHTFADNRDTYTKNYLLYHDLSGPGGGVGHPFRIISWDADATWGNNWDGAPVAPDGAKWHGTDAFSPRLFGIPEWKEAYLTAYREALAGDFAAAALTARIDAMAAKLRDAAMRDLEKWQPALSFDAEVTRLRDAVAARCDRMAAVLDEAAGLP